MQNHCADGLFVIHPEIVTFQWPGGFFKKKIVKEEILWYNKG